MFFISSKCIHECLTEPFDFCNLNVPFSSSESRWRVLCYFWFGLVIWFGPGPDISRTMKKVSLLQYRPLVDEPFCLFKSSPVHTIPMGIAFHIYFSRLLFHWHLQYLSDWCGFCVHHVRTAWIMWFSHCCCVFSTPTSWSGQEITWEWCCSGGKNTRTEPSWASRRWL